MELMTKIRKASKEAVEADGLTSDGKRTGLWSGLAEKFPIKGDPTKVSLRDLEERMMFAEALETIWTRV